MNHLACHIYPRKHGTWRRTVAHILARDRLFTGKRVIAIATDDTTDDPQEVRDSLSGFDAEFIIVENSPRSREVLTHWMLLKRIEGLPGSTFFCHGKGSTHMADSVTQQWGDVMWHVLCDYPEVVKCVLEQRACVGCFRRFEGLDCPWHFSGSFHWFRNADAFSRNWQNIDRHYYGTETWPAKQFSLEESACLFMDRCGDLYHPDYWTGEVLPLFRRWLEQLRFCGVSMTDCSTTDWSRLPETRFPPLIGWNGFGTTPRENESSRQIG